MRYAVCGRPKLSTNQIRTNFRLFKAIIIVTDLTLWCTVFEWHFCLWVASESEQKHFMLFIYGFSECSRFSQRRSSSFLLNQHTHIKITHKSATTTTTHKKWIACVRLISCSFVKRLQSLLCVSVTALYSLACQRFCHVFVCMHIMYVAAMRIEFCDTESVPIPSACIDSLNAVRCSFDQTNACLCLSYICV